MTSARKEVKRLNKEESAPKRHKVIALVEGVIIGTALILALGFALGVKYANHQNHDKQSAVTSAVQTLTVKK
jgi:hypothetical protein